MSDVPGLRPPASSSHARRATYRVVFEHDSAWGRAFDVALIAAIVGSVLAVMLESIAAVRLQYGPLLRGLEWGFTVGFTVEYVVRLWCVSRPLGYARSFFGVVDLLAILPTYISLLIPGGQVLTVVRVLRVLRIFRILKLAHYVGEARVLTRALKASRYKITVFIFTVLTVVVIVGALMYLVEGPASGFTSIPFGVYWGVVTLTTVGFGDVTPQTPLGQVLAVAVMILGYGIIAVPTGIVTAELASAGREDPTGRRCNGCGRGGHDADAHHCKWCGVSLPEGRGKGVGGGSSASRSLETRTGSRCPRPTG